MTEKERKYWDAEWLEEQYWGELRTTPDIADECGVTSQTISDWLDRHGIRTRTMKEANALRFGTSDSKHHDREWLRRKYEDEKLSSQEIAEICGVCKDTILYALGRANIPIRTYSTSQKYVDRRDMDGRNNHNWNEYIKFHLDTSGYESWTHSYQSEKNHVLVHRLLAVAEYGFDAVAGKEIHHKNKIRWDNRPENIVPLSPSEHIKLHRSMEKIPTETTQ